MNDQIKKLQDINLELNEDNIRKCPFCGLNSLKGMPGGKDSICENCGFKDPCCYD